ncbi:MAG: sigma-70 family RNA polymerase sigma factor [Clostridia bacterium]|nr:sigma-70 family RNA polymerase sigma factor [Clostridia bacterium]
MNDDAIVALYWQRDESAITVTQEKYNAYLMKIARNILNDTEDSEESVNDTYLAAWESMPPQKPTVLSTYLGKLTRRISISMFRKRNAAKRQGSEFALSISEVEEIMTDHANPEKELEASHLGELLNAFLCSLKPDERNSFIGRYYYMDSLKDVAGYCGMTEGKAKTVLFRTRQKLKEYLTKEGYEL